MRRIVDLHTHLLPGVDDGVRTLPEALTELREARAQGITAVACTPHVHPLPSVDLRRILEARRRIHETLVETAAAAGGLPEIGLGSEVLIDKAAPDLRSSALRLNGTPYALVEIGFVRESFESLRDVFRELLDEGWRPILAHAERYVHLRRADESLETWREDGLLVQVNASSLAGVHGQTVRERAWELVERGSTDLVASDVHGAHMRRNHTEEAWNLVVMRAGRDIAKRLFETIPAEIFRGRDVIVARSGGEEEGRSPG
jgi:protein-tyrosine phosphatase